MTNALRTLCLLAAALPLFAAQARAQHNDLVSFSYTGMVRVQGEAFNGKGAFKLAIVDQTGNTALWSNDATSVRGDEPESAVQAPVEAGVFNLTVGGAGMAPINRTIFNQPSQIKLRVWFSDGEHGFQQLLPDRDLHNIELLALRTGTEDFTIYVDGARGDDAQNGLTTATAKKTIQAAVDVLPQRIRSNVVVDVAPGVYREQVSVVGVTVYPDKTLTILGDKDWRTTCSAAPAVRIAGADLDTSPALRLRDHGFYVEQASGVVLEGFQVDSYRLHGVLIKGSSSAVVRRMRLLGGARDADGLRSDSSQIWLGEIASEGNANGLMIDNSRFTAENVACVDNYFGGSFYQSSGTIENAVFNRNVSAGLLLTRGSSVTVHGTCDFSHNEQKGVWSAEHSMLWFWDGYRGTVAHNGGYGLVATLLSSIVHPEFNEIAGNGGRIYVAGGSVLQED